jgi:type IV secretory pathway VirJ component
MPRSTWCARRINRAATGNVIITHNTKGTGMLLNTLQQRMRAIARAHPALAALLLLASLPAHGAPADPVNEATLEFGHFASVHIYRNAAQPKHVVLLASGDDGWNRDMIDMARTLAGQDALVAGIDTPAYLRRLAIDKDACGYPAADFEGLSQYLQKHYEFPDYVQPVLVGYWSGATLGYATLAQSPPNTFRGGISLGFCPELASGKPPCRGSGLQFTPHPDGKGYTLLPATQLATPWTVLQGTQDAACSADTVAQFVAQTGHAQLLRLPGAGHGFSVAREWLPQLQAALRQLDPAPVAAVAATSAPADLAGLPLVEVTVPQPGRTFAVILSGDGGWASIDKSLAETLAARNIPTVGLDSLHYFWTRRTPDETGVALTRILRHYFAAWQMDKVILIGYSRGADVLPFMASRLPPELFGRVALIALLGAEHHIEFEFHVSDWLPGNMKDAPHLVKPEVEKLAHDNVLCIYGADEPAPLCPDLDPTQFKLRKLPGGHHFGGDYDRLAGLILHEAR